MSNIKTVVFVFLLILLLSPTASHGTVINVPSDHSTIQAAMDAWQNGDEIVVAPGIYQENIDFGGKDISLRSTEPTNASVVASTIIDGASSEVVVRFSGSETSLSILSGFTIRNGRAKYGAGIYGGSSFNGSSGATATIKNNVIKNNFAEQMFTDSFDGSGGGIYNCDGLIENNTISGNRAAVGGGLSECDGTVRGNTIKDNLAKGGGGIYFSGSLIEGNTFTGNEAANGGAILGSMGVVRNNSISHNISNGALPSGGYSGWGSAFSACYGTIENNIVWSNTSLGSATFYYCDANIIHNTIYGNDAESTLLECSGTIKNCIIWSSTGVELSQCSLPSYSCIKNYSGGGTGNISSDPLLRSPSNGDFHLTPNSPCIDAGCEIAGMAEDFEGQARPYDATDQVRGDGSDTDIGADEYYPEVSGVTIWQSYK